MRSSLVSIFAIFLYLSSNGQIYSGSTSFGGSNLSLDITLNTNLDSVQLEFSGPASGYYAVGFGSTGMSGTYTLLVNSNGTVQERKLGSWNGGSSLTSSVSYNSITSSGTRTASIERARIGASADHYTFSPTGGSITLIWARGGSNFSNHGSSNRGATTINLVNQCNIPNTVNPTLTLCANDSVQVFGNWVSQAGMYYDSLTTSIGCDSVVEQNVNVIQPDSVTVADVELCAGDSVFYIGAWRSSVGPVTEVYQNQSGCDSSVFGSVNILPNVDTGSVWLAPFADVSFYVGTDTLATYYWFNCNTGAFVDTTQGADTLNPGNEFLQAPGTGYYAAVIVRPGYCPDTSSCVYFYVGLDEFNNELTVAPNPAKDVLRVNLTHYTGPKPYEMYSLSGAKVGEGILNQTTCTLDVSSYASGAYFLRTESGHIIRWLKN